MAEAFLDASLVVMLAVVTASDLRSRTIPDWALIAAFGLGIPLSVVADPASMPERTLASLGAGGLLLAAALVRPHGMGLGDVKLAAVLGFYLGSAMVAAMLVAFGTGSIAGLVVLARHGWAARGRAIPFAPYLAIGAFAAMTSQP